MHKSGWIWFGIIVFQVCLCMGGIQIVLYRYLTDGVNHGKPYIRILLVDVGCMFPLFQSIPMYIQIIHVHWNFMEFAITFTLFEHGHLSIFKWIYPLNTVIFPSYVNVYHRVNPIKSY